MHRSRFLTVGSAELFVVVFAGPVARDLLPLLEAERGEFEAVLGTRVVFANTDPPGRSPRWVIRPPTGDHLPSLSWDETTRTLTSFAATARDLANTLQSLHTLAWCSEASVTPAPAATVAEATQRIQDEVANTYPSFHLRGLDWDQITARHLPLLLDADPSSFQDLAAAWVAELGDAHTSVRSTAARFNPPYRGLLTHRGVILNTVPPTSAAAAAGVQPEWIVQVADPDRVLRTTGASPQHHAQVAARRALTVTGDERVFTARNPADTAEVSWTETVTAPTLASTLHTTRDTDGGLTATLDTFNGALDLAAEFDDLFAGATPTDQLRLDLRGNPGGSLVTATQLRDRFLRTRTHLGAVQFTTGTGALAVAQPLYAEPSDAVRWPGQTTLLVDEMTYSAAEDFALGLQGLEHITVLGTPTGGGSGRPRTIPLFQDLVLTISTALTYDRTGRCIEFNGLPTDGPIK